MNILDCVMVSFVQSLPRHATLLKIVHLGLHSDIHRHFNDCSALSSIFRAVYSTWAEGRNYRHRIYCLPNQVLSKMILQTQVMMKQNHCLGTGEAISNENHDAEFDVLMITSFCMIEQRKLQIFIYFCSHYCFSTYRFYIDYLLINSFSG